MAQFFFDSSTVQAAVPQTFEVLPAGAYIAQAVESSYGQMKNGNGDELGLTFVVLDGAYKGRKLWSRLYVKHTNEKTQAIAQEQLSALCKAIGVVKVTDTAVLERKPVSLVVAIEPATGGYPAKNVIKGYVAPGGQAPAAAFTAPAAAPQGAASNVPSWAKKA